MVGSYFKHFRSFHLFVMHETWELNNLSVDKMPEASFRTQLRLKKDMD